MVRSVNIDLDDAEFERLSRLKDEQGMTWREALKHGFEV